MVSLDNLVVTTALPVIKADLGASLAQLEWTVNAYTLTFAVLLLTGAALGDRFGRKRVFIVGLSDLHRSARRPRGARADRRHARPRPGDPGRSAAAIVTPLTLTMLSAAVPPERRGLALGAWGAISGLAIALGPLVGGAIVEGLSWQWIFWLNVPIGVLVVSARRRACSPRATAPSRRLDLPGLGLASGGLLALVWALIHGNERGLDERRHRRRVRRGRRAPRGVRRLGGSHRLARCSRSASSGAARFSTANGVSMLMSFGVFGSIFLLAQFFQIVQGYSPFEAGLRTLPWTAMPIIVAPIAGVLSDRIGSRPLLVVGHGADGRRASPGWPPCHAPTVEYLLIVPAFVLAGVGMSLLLRPDREPRPLLGPARRRRASPRARTTRSARSAACSGSRSSPRSSRRTAATRQPAGVRRRARPGRLGWGGGGRGRRAGRPGDPGSTPDWIGRSRAADGDGAVRWPGVRTGAGHDRSPTLDHDLLIAEGFRPPWVTSWGGSAGRTVVRRRSRCVR